MNTAPSHRLTLAFAALLGALLLAYVGFNAGPGWLVLDIETTQADTAQLFYSNDGGWNELESLRNPLTPGLNRVSFRLPSPRWGVGVRLDPGMQIGTYHVLGMHWYRGFFAQEIPFSGMRSARSDGLTLRENNGAVDMEAQDGDPQLLIAPPGLGWQLASLAWPLGVYGAGVFVPCFLAWRKRIGPVAIAGAYVAAATAFYVMLLWRHAPQLPILDDWRYVLPGRFNIVDGGGEWLRAVGNDTYFLTGQLFDFLSLTLSHDNFVVVRTVGLALLVLHLWLMWRLLRRVGGGISQGYVAVGLALLVWCLASNSYWGGTAIAYHQFLPVLAGSLMLVQLANKDGELGRPASLILLGLTAVASGVAYISGGLMVMALGAAMLLTHIDRLRQFRHTPALRSGAFLLALGMGLLVLQLVLVTRTQGSLLEHSHAAATIYPNDRRFWLFITAQFGRALGYSGFNPSVDIALTVLVLSPAVWLGVQRLRDGLVRGQPAEHPTLLALALYGGIAVSIYSAVVAFGRAAFVPVDAASDLVVAVAKGRFHYWTVAAMLPFLWLGCVVVAQGLRKRWSSLALLAMAVIMLVPKSQAPWDLVLYFRAAGASSIRGAQCIASHLEPPESTQPFTCWDIVGLNIDLSGSMQKQKDKDSALYHQIERYRHSPLP